MIACDEHRASHDCGTKSIWLDLPHRYCSPPPRSVKYSTRSHTHKCLDIAVRHAYSPHKLHIICCCSLQAEFHGARLRRKHEWRLFHATVQTPIHVAILLKSIISEFARPPGFPPNWVPFPAPHIDSGLPQPDRYLKTYGGDIDLLGRKASCMIMAIRLYGYPPPPPKHKRNFRRYVWPVLGNWQPPRPSVYGQLHIFPVGRTQASLVMIDLQGCQQRHNKTGLRSCGLEWIVVTWLLIM